MQTPCTCTACNPPARPRLPRRGTREPRGGSSRNGRARSSPRHLEGERDDLRVAVLVHREDDARDDRGEPDLVDEIDQALLKLERDLAIAPAENLFEGLHTMRVYNLLIHGKTFEKIGALRAGHEG